MGSRRPAVASLAGCRNPSRRPARVLARLFVAEPQLALSRPHPYVGSVAARAKQPVQIAVTGPAGQVGYALIFRIASGELLGPDTPIVLRLLEIEPAMKALEGCAMELEDCAFPLLVDVVATSDAREAFDGVSWAMLVAAMPRKAGMERSDLLAVNGGIFKPQGEALADRAADDLRVLVVGNPCNTNCLIARSNAPDIPDDRWFAMTRLDQNRAAAQLARRAGVPVAEVSRIAIWGNHSATQFPDFTHARIAERPVPEVIEDREWLRGDFIITVQKRGAAIIDARGASSAASAANAIIDSVRSVHFGTGDDWASLAIQSRGEYGVPDGLVFSLPCISDGRSVSVVEGLEHDEFAADKIRITTEELVAERDAVADLIPG